MKKFVLAGLLFFLCLSCQFGNPITSTVVSPMVKTLERATIAPTGTRTPYSTSTPTLQPPYIKTVAYNLLATVPENDKMQGIIVVGDHLYLNGQPHHAYLINAQSKEKTADLYPNMTEINQLGYFALSPDGRKLAYFSKVMDQKNLVIVDSSGKVIHNQIIENSDGRFILDSLTPGAETWGGMLHWLNDEQLVTEKWPPRAVIETTIQPYSTVLYDPSTGKAQEYPPVYPDITGQFLTIPLPGWGYPEMVFDPTLTRLVYGTNDSGVILWDLQQAKEIIRFPSGAISFGPVWRKDGTEFVIALHGDGFEKPEIPDELILVDRDGQTTRLTNLGNFSSEATIMYPRFSPDETRIAFFVSLHPDPCEEEWNIHPAVIALDDLPNVNIYCGVSVQGFTEPLWSPDGSQLLVTEYSSGDNAYSAIVLDMEDEYMAILGIDMVSLAWMVNPENEP